MKNWREWIKWQMWKRRVNRRNKIGGNYRWIKVTACVLTAVMLIAMLPNLGSISALLPKKAAVPKDDNVIENVDTADLSAHNPVPDPDAVPEHGGDASIFDNTAHAEGAEEPERNPYLDENNALTVPYDVAYPEEFASGEVAYSDTQIMVKLRASVGGKLTKELKDAGLIGLEELFALEDSAWYLAYVDEDKELSEVMESVRAASGVLVAEYDLEKETCATIIDADHISAAVAENARADEQWYLKACGIQDAWAYQQEHGLAVAGQGAVVAVIDTGVDYDHIDLAANMWKNTAEIPDNGKDDDGNGYVDDYYGVNVITGKGNGDDDHGHGTHVAGIIAAVNNKEGTVGIAYNAKIMAIKAGNASGYFNSSDIVKAVTYAYEKGADVINMSFGGYSITIAEQDALAVAYTSCVLVAAAGNDGWPCEEFPSYPAALGYVLGVESVDSTGTESSFSNWDVQAYNSMEYELAAPGEAMLSTIPGDRYASWNGTSMASPVAAAAAAMLRAAYPDMETYPTRYIYGQLASTSDLTAACISPFMHGNHNLVHVLDTDAAFTKVPMPDVELLDYVIFDSVDLSDKNNGDGVIDAGETIALGLTLKNHWGMSRETMVTVDAIGEKEVGIADPYLTFVGDTTIDYGPIGTYSNKDCGKVYDNDKFVGWEHPFIFTVAQDCPNDYRINLNITIEAKNGMDPISDIVYSTNRRVEVLIRRGTVVPTYIEEDMTLDNDHLWIIDNGTIIADGAVVTVDPGTEIQFYSSDPEDPYADSKTPYLYVQGKLYCNGTPDQRIYIHPCDSMKDFAVDIHQSNDGYVALNYCDVENFSVGRDETTEHNGIAFARGCTFSKNYIRDLKFRFWKDSKVVTEEGFMAIRIYKAVECVFDSIGNSGTRLYSMSGTYTRCIFSQFYGYLSSADFDHCVFLRNYMDSSYGPKYAGVYNADIYNKNFSGVTITSWKKVGSSQKNDGWYECDAIGKKYLFVQVGLNSYGSFASIESFAEYLGGTIACINSEEELAALKNVSISGGLAFPRMIDEDGIFCWMDGSPLNDYEQFFNKEYMLTKLTDSGFYSPTVSSVSKVIMAIELPIKVDAPNTQEELTAAYNSFRQEEEKLSTFSRNAILNPLIKTSTNYWMRMNAPTATGHEVFAIPGNYWGTTNEELIKKQIVDFDQNPSLLDIDPSGYLTSAPEDVWPFVTRAYTMVNGAAAPVVGAEEVTFCVEFNRDMDTTIPLDVRYGSAEPYADQKVEGAYVNARLWQGTAKISSIVANGQQIFNITNGRAAGTDMYLVPDSGRFEFSIDTTAALAMNLQAVATMEGVQLTWFQDDFDTLAGYNVYRSEAEDGYFQKLNPTIIPLGEEEYLDRDVEPGKRYYYNFTVVLTDMTESVPSGKTSVVTLDTVPPGLYHTSIGSAFTGSKIMVRATATDNVGVERVTLYYRITGTEDWKTVTMTATNDKYQGGIPVADVTVAGIEYYLDAFDGVSHTLWKSAEEPQSISVQYAVDENSKGDVDGNGVIDSLDALLILQAKNDLVNLTPDEFARADIDGNGELSAKEALRVLMYVSGKVTSILF